MVQRQSGRLCCLSLASMLLLTAGCSAGQQPASRPALMAIPATQPTTAPAPAPVPTDASVPASRPIAFEDPRLQALCMPPAGWTDKGIKEGSNHIRRLWVNPAGNVGYGVVRASLPLPVGESIVLSAFLAEVQKTQGKTTIIEKRSSDEGLTFVAQNTILRYEGRVHCHGLRGWIVFASSLTDRPIDPNNLKVAETARDATVLGQ